VGVDGDDLSVVVCDLQGALRRELTKCLRTGRSLRKPGPRAVARNRARDMINIAQRPQEADDRAVPGHWEGDLLIGKNNQTAIATLVERSTGYALLVALPDGYKPEQVAPALAAKIKTLPDSLRRTLTWDQGPEMRDWKQLRVDAGIEVYFCDPHAPWQRGTNENTNGLLRQYFPKGTDFSTIRLQVRAWQQYFAAMFGLEALGRVRGFSPSEMALPNHPDVAYEFVRTLRDCGYCWVLVQEHTVEELNGGGVRHLHLPNRLVCTNSRGKSASIVAIVKTQGSDTKLVGQMQPYYEARGLERSELAGRSVPPLVTQIADGENGGVMMNDFPPKYFEVVRESSWSTTPMLNGTEYLERLFATGVSEDDLPVIQPLFQGRIWERMSPGDGPERLAGVIEELRREDDRFHMEGGSWTNDISWVRGYDSLLRPMDRASVAFHEGVLGRHVPPTDYAYRNALFHLLTAESSDFRYWGRGEWTDYGVELARRTTEIVTHDF